MQHNHLCSVIIPAYNCENFIIEAIQSAIGQTYQNIEILVIDDCSTDSTYERICAIAKTDSRIIPLQNPHNMGVARTRNYGFQKATGSYIALLDGDDLWLLDKLQKQIAQLEDSGTDICCTAYDLIDEEGQPTGKCFIPPKKTSFSRLRKQNFIGCSTALFRRQVIEQIQMRPEFSHEDYAFWLEAAQAGFQITALRQPLVQYRILQNSRSANKLRSAYNCWLIYRKFMKYNLPRASYYFIWYAIYGTLRRL